MKDMEFLEVVCGVIERYEAQGLEVVKLIKGKRANTQEAYIYAMNHYGEGFVMIGYIAHNKQDGLYRLNEMPVRVAELEEMADIVKSRRLFGRQERRKRFASLRRVQKAQED